jgi:hypothetical protein
MAIIQTPQISNVVEDTTPQLGGNLDCQDYRLQWSGSSQYIGSTILGAGLTVSSGSNNLTLSSNGNLSINTNGSERAVFESSGGLTVGGDVRPQSISEFYDCGTASLRWATVYTADVNATGTTTIAGLVTDIETFTASSDTLDTANHVCLCDCSSNSITINLPAASGNAGLQYHIKKTDSTSNTVTIDGSGSETIDGGTTAIIRSQYESVTVSCDGTQWWII